MIFLQQHTIILYEHKSRLLIKKFRLVFKGHLTSIIITHINSAETARVVCPEKCVVE